MIVTPVEIRDAILMAVTSARSNKFRSFMTILGVMVGVASVIAMASVIDGLDGAVEGEIDRLGSNVIMVHKFAHDTDWDNLSDEERNRKAITVGEAEAILRGCPSVSAVAPRNYYFRPGGNEAKFKNRKFDFWGLMGTWPTYTVVREKNLSKGRFFTQTDEQYRLMVCCIGSDVADGLFEDEEPVGQEIRVNGDKFRVVGVFENVKSNFGGGNSENRQICIPLATYQKLIPWEKELGLDVRAVSYDLIDQAKEEIITALRVYRKVPFSKPDDFALSTQDQFKDEFGTITDGIYIAMVIITSVGLMVGGIGVMNIMLVSVTERTREIGVRKAIGAKRSNIVLQFLTEAMSLSGIGGVIGIIFGLILGIVINNIASFPVTLPVFWVVVGFMVSVTVGLVSGVYPAFKAAKLDPIEALRYE